MTEAERIVAVLRARLAMARVTAGKASALLNRVCPDGRLRGTLAYHAAHTGRWGGRGFQPQNLPRAVRIPEDIWDRPEEAPLIAARQEDTAEIIGSMLRGCLVAPPGRYLAAVDLRQIEARCLLWMAGDEEGLAPYRRGEDPYCALASRIWREPVQKDDPRRQAAKTVVLACGYQGGAEALQRYADKSGVDLGAVGIAPEMLVEGWRDAHPLVAGTRRGTWVTPEGRTVATRVGGLWRDARDAAWEVVAHGGERHAGRCRFSRSGPDLLLTLPSGRSLRYRDAQLEEVDTRWGGRAMQVTYAHPGGGRRPTYGGRWVENQVQAACRDILADALVALEAEGLRPVLHVHDEVICEVDSPDDLARVESVMLRQPPWADGLPLAVEGSVGPRYAK